MKQSRLKNKTNKAKDPVDIAIRFIWPPAPAPARPLFSANVHAFVKLKAGCLIYFLDL